MRKQFTLIAGMLLGACTYGSAQTTLFTENFESATGSALPTGWTNESDPSGGWATKTGATSWLSGQFTIPAHTRYAILDDYTVAAAKNDNTLLVSPSIDLSANWGAILEFQYLMHGVFINGQPPVYQEAQVLVSDDNGVTWNVAQNLAGVTAWTKVSVDLSSYLSDKVKVAFRFNDQGRQFLGIGVDDVTIYQPKYRYNVELDSMILPRATKDDMVAATGVPVKLDIFNNSGTKVTSLNISYKINGGTPVTQTLSGLNIAALGRGMATLAMPAISGTTSVMDLEITGINNGNVDEVPADNSKSATFKVASKLTSRPCLIEEFTSSTCPPCASFNAFFDPMIETIGVNKPGSNFNIIKYQMNYPNTGDDRSYNAHSGVRHTYYGVRGIPDHYTHGMPGGNGSEDEINACKDDKTSFMDIKATYNVKGDSLYATVDLTPYFTLPVNHRLHVALVENEYHNKFAATSQSNYIHVMRDMLTGSNGYGIASYADGVPMSFSYKKKYDCWENGVEVKQGSSTFWSHPMNSTLLVFVQDNSTKAIMQSLVVPAAWPTTVEEKAAGLRKIDLAPNPSTDRTHILFTLDKTSDVQVSVTDAMGRVVYNNAVKAMGAGAHQMVLSTSEFATGLYNVRIQTADGAVTKRLSVLK